MQNKFKVPLKSKIPIYDGLEKVSIYLSIFFTLIQRNSPFPTRATRAEVIELAWLHVMDLALKFAFRLSFEQLVSLFVNIFSGPFGRASRYDAEPETRGAHSAQRGRQQRNSASAGSMGWPSRIYPYCATTQEIELLGLE